MLLNKTQPNLVLLGQGRKEGKHSNLVEIDSFLEHTDIAIVEKSLNWTRV
jgi:hypothetical protein